MTGSTWTPAQSELFRLVGERAPAEGWRVTRRDDGFDLDRDLTRETRDAETGASPERTRWRNLTHEVRFDPDGRYVVTDVDRSVQVDRRGATQGMSRSTFRGRKVGGGGSMRFTFEGDRLRRIDDHRYDLSAGRELVDAAAEDAGLARYRKPFGWEGWVGLGFAVLAVLGLVIGGVVVLLIELVG